METERTGIQGAREDLADTRHGETLGSHIPAQKKSQTAEVEAMPAAAKTSSCRGVQGDSSGQLREAAEAQINALVLNANAF